MAVQACLNGSRSREEHPALPQSPAELGADAGAVRTAGAFAVHIHPRDARGRPTLRAPECGAAVAAIRAAARGLPVGLSTAEDIDPDPFARAAALARWRERPDFVSVNLSELGWAGIARAALHAGMQVEAGLSTSDAAQEFARSPFVHQVLRVLIEVEGGAPEARTIAERVPAGVRQLWHGAGEQTWEVIVAGAALGHDVRVGLEDTLILADGRVAADNAELVAEAVRLIAGGS